MKRASNILFKVGIAVQFVLMGTFISLGLFFLLFTSPGMRDIIIQGLEEGWIETTMEGTPEEIAAAVQMVYGALAAVFIPIAILALVSALLCIKAVKRPSRGVYIANIIFGALTDSGLPIVGAILGLITLSQEEKKE